jgi:bifunctional non-homologous end joining protein LigD
VDRPSFTRLQRRMHVDHPNAALVEAVPSLYVIFDVLYLDGESLINKPFADRRAMLEELTLMGPSWQVSPAHIGEGDAMLATARENRLEGVVAKKLDGVYEPGRRSTSWLKVKIVQRQEFVIGGWTDEKGSSGRLGALLVGYYENKCVDKNAKPRAAKMRYAGRVGSGFTGETQALMQKILRELAADESPFTEKVPKKSVHFVKPQLVAEVEYRRWPQGGQIQQAAFKGLRTDKRSREVIKEDPDCLP